jgi:protein-S-isoprenylcysteine O-methyltransferase Ste14
MPLVNEGIFRYTRNGMYGPGFLVFWGMAVACDSTGALLAAAFAHAYIWVHHLATEKPDMDAIYGC